MNGASKNPGIPAGSQYVPWERGPAGLTWLPDTLTEVQFAFGQAVEELPFAD